MDLRELERFVVAARERTCLGQGQRLHPERPGAVEVVYREGGLAYRDSYFGQKRLFGQEVVRRAGTVIWTMNYMIDIVSGSRSGEELASFLQRAQMARYRERRLLGPHLFQERSLRYEDQNAGDLDLFQGEIVIHDGEQVIFRMPYGGGTVR